MANRTMTQASVLVAQWLAEPTSLRPLLQQLLGEPSVAVIKQVGWHCDTILPQCYSLAVTIQDDWGRYTPVQLYLVTPDRQLPAALRHLTTLVTKARQVPQPPLAQPAVTFFLAPLAAWNTIHFIEVSLDRLGPRLRCGQGKLV